MRKGFFITFEGTECSGKSTQIKILSEKIKSEGFDVICLREPGGTPIGEEIRHILKHSINGFAMVPETELLLMNASRAQIVREIIRPALAEGKIVLCDRFYDSTIAYQGFGRGLNLEDVLKIIDFAVGNTIPDLTILLDIPIEIIYQRQKLRNSELNSASTLHNNNQNLRIRDRFEEADLEFFKRVHEGFEFISNREPQRIKKVDATREIEPIASQIWEIVGPLIQKIKTNR
ncbi:MAG: dTMP kinase [Verrucomicrobiae bacterium]|nr:dTMP kinase [Verrucomicrobiae bacterium]